MGRKNDYNRITSPFQLEFSNNCEFLSMIIGIGGTGQAVCLIFRGLIELWKNAREHFYCWEKPVDGPFVDVVPFVGGPFLGR